VALPFGWTPEDLAQASELAASYGSPLEDILGIWFSESGLNPRNVAQAGALTYYGLIMGLDAFVTQAAGMEPGRWAKIVLGEPLSTELFAIKRFWDAVIRQWLGAAPGSEGAMLRGRASHLGITPAGMLYALNFVPAWAVRMKTADQPMVRSAEAGGGDPSAPDSEARYYRDNPGFDITKKGYISLRDMDLRISAFKSRAKSGATGQLFVEGSEIVPVSYVEPQPEAAPKKPGSSPWPAIFGFGAFMGAVFLGLHYVEKLIPKESRS